MKETAIQRRHLFRLLLMITVMTAFSGCGGSADPQGSRGSPQVLTGAEAKSLLLQLPYRYRWRQVKLPKGASGALAGTVTGDHHTVVHFGISLGTKAEAVPVPQAGVLSPYYYGKLGFVFNDDLVLPKGVGRQFHTATQWHEAINMVFEMEEKLCRAISGKPCPV